MVFVPNVEHLLLIKVRVSNLFPRIWRKMYKPSFFETFTDLTLPFLFGGILSYIHYFLFPIPMTYQMIASGLLAFSLGSLGARFDEIIKWVLFFCFGIFVSVCSPQLIGWTKTGIFPLGEVLSSVQASIPYFFELLSAWAVMVPLGLAVFKIFRAQRHYYRHARFF